MHEEGPVGSPHRLVDACRRSGQMESGAGLRSPLEDEAAGSPDSPLRDTVLAVLSDSVLG